jgi:hypothetical protein
MIVAFSRERGALAERGAARAWNAALFAIVVAALIVQIVLLLGGGADANAQAGAPVSAGWRLLRFFSYFTVQSNIIVVVAAATLVAAPDRDGRVWRILRLDALLGIVITGLVFAIVLAPHQHLSGLAAVLNIAFHYFSPIWTLVGWLLFGPRPRITTATVAGAFAWPLGWLVYTFVHGAISDWYPYPFVNADLHGYGVALRNTAAVIVIGVLIALAFKRLDRLPTYRGYQRS